MCNSDQTEDSKRNTFLNTYLPKAVGVSQLTVNVVLIFASFFTLYEYSTVREEKRIEETMNQVTIFNSPELIKARLGITKYSEDTKKFISEKINKESFKDKNTIENKMDELGRKDPQLNENALLILNFFSNLQICVKNRICDEKVTNEYFCRYAFYFNNQYEFLFKENKNTEYAYMLLEKFSSQCQFLPRPEDNP